MLFDAVSKGVARDPEELRRPGPVPLRSPESLPEPPPLDLVEDDPTGGEVHRHLTLEPNHVEPSGSSRLSRLSA